MSKDTFPTKRHTTAMLSPDLLFIIALQTYPTLDIRGLIPLSQVCRHWRHAFLSYPSLWTKITPPNLSISLVNMMLVRSADCSLQVAFQAYPDKEATFRYCDLIFAHIHRIETLIISKVWVDYDEIMDYIFPLLERPALKLKVFRFDQPVHPGHLPKLVPKNLLYQAAPKLEEFGISFLSISYEMPIFKSITRLSLRQISGIASMVQLINILETTSNNLEALDLGDLIGLSPVLEIHTLDGRLVHLLSLQFLSLSLAPDVLMSILDHIKIPFDINWDINCFDAIDEPELDITPLLCFLDQAQKGTFLNLTLEFDSDDVRLDFGRSITAPYNASLQMNLPPSQNLILQLERICANLGFSKVCSCRIDITWTQPLCSDRYIAVLGLLFPLFSGLLELIVICKEGNKAPLPIIAQLRPSHEMLPCPLLSHLTLKPVTSNNKSWIQVLEERKVAGTTLTSIRVVAEPYEPSIQEELEMLAKNVIVVAEN